MDLTVNTALPRSPADSLAALRRAGGYGAATGKPAQTPPTQNLPAPVQAFKTDGHTATRLMSENRLDLADGAYRLTRTYEREDGRSFTRIEDFAFTERGTRRNVIQQNPSGNITEYEEVLDREDGGTFRRTQRFRDESGETATQITTRYNVTDPFILTGGYAAPAPSGTNPFAPLRGTQLDLQA